MPGPRGGQLEHGGGGRTTAAPSGPRVVIFEGGDGPQIEVVELSGKTTIGEQICHRGASWLVTGLRTHNRVIICQPAEA